MIDKRFWAGAILAMTVVVAGAGSLPALLLRPISTDSPPAAPVPMGKVAEPVQAPVEAKMGPGPIAPAPADSVAEPPKPTPPPAPQTVAAPPPQAAAAPAAAPATFPPVQPVDLAGATAPVQAVAAPPPDGGAARAAVPAPEKTARPERTAKQTLARQKLKPVRPAPYPMREFFAWRR